MTPGLDTLVSYGFVAGAEEDACGVGEELVASGAAKTKIGVKLGATGREELVTSGIAKVKTGVKLDATGGVELVAFVATVKIGFKLGATGGTEMTGATDGVIVGSLVLDGVWIARFSAWLVSGVTVLVGGGAWKTGSKGVVLALNEDL